MTNKRLVGRFNFRKEGSINLYFENIESLNVVQSFIGRTFNVGTIIINTITGESIIITGIAFPEKLNKEFIDFTKNRLCIIKKFQ